MQTVIIRDLRPDEIILAYWREIPGVDDDGEMLLPERLEGGRLCIG